jgi:hypothetical protein
MTHKGCTYYGYNPVISNTNTTQTQIDMDIGNTFSLKDEYIRDKYKTSKIDFIRGHIKTIGRTSNQEKNPLWKIQNEN